MRLTPGTRLGPFEVVTSIGAGGMGEVYRARDTRLGRDVAIKLLPAEFVSSRDRMARFEREARTVAGLAHPNIVVLHSIEEHDGTRFLVLELVEGRDLTAIIVPGGLPIDRVLAVAIPIADALVAAHEKGVVHRDLKPANVMVSPDGRVKMLDFGLAKDTSADAHATIAATITEAGQALGTVAYMAPEQVRGEPVDARTDLFAFGIVLCELATGQRPFTGATPADVASAILRDPPASLKQLPADLVRIVERLLAKNPRERYQTALDVLNELKHIGRTAPAPASPREVVSIAVLPFANRSASADDEYFAEGLADELLGVLGRIRGLRVAARTSSARFKGEDPSSIGRTLNVATVLEGSVRKAANRVRITVQLVKVEDGFQVWSETYDRTLDDIFAVQDDIAQSVVKELRKQLLGEADDSDTSRGLKAEVARAVQGRTANPEAHRLLLQARHMLESRRDDQADRAIGLLEQALELDPDFALAYVTLGQIHGWKADYLSESRVERRELAHAMLARALALEPELAEAHILRAWVTYALDLNWKAGWTAAQRALQLDPSDARVLRIAGMIARSGRLPEATELSLRALEADPVSSLAHHNAGHLASILGRQEEAREYFRRAIELAPDAVGTRAMDAMSLLALGRPDEALERARQESDYVFGPWSRSIILFAMGSIEESDRELRFLIDHHPLAGAAQIAEAYARRGDVENALTWIERGIAAHDGGIMVTHASRAFIPMRGDPRWNDLMRRMGYDD